MTTASTGKANASLVKSYQALVHTGDSGVRGWYRQAFESGVSVRDFKATIEEAKKSGEVRGITKNSASFLPIIVKAFDLKGADKVSVIEICKVAEVAQRALKAEQGLALVAKSADFDDFKAKAEQALDEKPTKPRVERKAGEVTLKFANMDALIANFLENMGEFEDVTIADLNQAEYMVNAVKSAIASSKAIASKHPTRKAVAK